MKGKEEQAVARIKIKDLPKTQRISKQEMKSILGGGWSADDILFGGKFSAELTGATEPFSSASGGGLTFEKKEASEGSRE